MRLVRRKKALIYYNQDFRVYEGTRDQPIPGPFLSPPIFQGKNFGDEVVDLHDMIDPIRLIVRASNAARLYQIE